MRVVVNYQRDVEAAKATATAIESEGGEVMLVQADVGDATQVDALFDEIEGSFGTVTVLVNNAGIRRDGLAMRMSADDFSEVLRVNLLGPFLCSKRALKGMVSGRRGRIVNVSSVAGLRASPGQINYSAAKAGVVGMTRTLAREVGRKGITVNAVAPGIVATDLTTSLPQTRFDELTAGVPSGRAGDVDEIAKSIAFLCSEEAAYINGEVLTIDGGMTA